jgi:hypothetical protein
VEESAIEVRRREGIASFVRAHGRTTTVHEPEG